MKLLFTRDFLRSGEEPKQQWLDIFDKSGVPNGPINNMELVVNDPQVQVRDDC